MMTWNLQRERPQDWRARVDEVASFLRRERPGLLLLQEATPHQLGDVCALLPGLRCLPAAPDAYGERNAILYDPTRFAVEAHGSLRLARVAGSARRTATWGRFVDLTTGARLTVLNAHFDHESPRSRLLAAQQLRERFPHAVIAGDLNAEPGSDPADVLARTHADPFPASGAETMVGEPGDTADARYDWILVPEGWEALDARVLRDAPSDHHALAAEILPRHVDEPTG